jgi:hypothetical protein
LVIVGDIEETVKVMLSVHGDHATAEGRQMVEKLSRRKDKRAHWFWERVYLALADLKKFEDQAPRGRNRWRA